MGMIEDVVTYLDANSTSFAAGTNLFAHTMPETTVTTCAIFERQSVEPVRRMSTGNTVQKHTIQLFVRSTVPAGGESIPIPTASRAKADTAWEILDRVTNATISGTTYLRIEPLFAPFEAARDERGRIIFSFSAIVWRA